MLTILHLSDTHSGAAGPLSDGSAAGADPAEALARIIELVTEKVDVVVHTGDIADAGDAADTAAVLDRLAVLGAPIVAVPGNHDRPAALAAVPGARTTLEVGGWRVLGVDSSVAGQIHGTAAGIIPALDAYDDRPTVLAIHHPIRSRSSHPWFTLRGDDGLLRALEERPHVRAVLSGHTHERYEQIEPWGLRHFGAPAVYYGMRHDGDRFTVAPAETGATLLTLTPSGEIGLVRDLRPVRAVDGA